MLRQRVLVLCLGYEDLNDHDRLRQDPLFATACGVLDPTGRERKYARDQGKALAGKSTLNRLETTPPGSIRPRSKKIIYNPQAIKSYFVQKFLQSRRSAPRRLILDLDCTDTILHGHQQGRFFHGYYDCYCYLPRCMCSAARTCWWPACGLPTLTPARGPWRKSSAWCSRSARTGPGCASWCGQTAVSAGKRSRSGAKTTVWIICLGWHEIADCSPASKIDPRFGNFFESNEKEIRFPFFTPKGLHISILSVCVL